MESAEARKARLKALREAAAGADEANVASAAPEEPVLKFRNYAVKDQNNIEHKTVDAAQAPEFVAPVVEPSVVQEVQGEGDDIINVAPKKANWDLRRDVGKGLEKLERRTKRALDTFASDEEDAASSHEDSEASHSDNSGSEPEAAGPVGETEQTPRQRQRVLRSSQNCEHGAPELPDREVPLSSDAQGDESDEGPLEMLGKRKRATVDYRKLNAEMFGDVESYEGEATEDEDFSPRAEARAGGES